MTNVTEKLLDFDLAAFKADPTRVRSRNGMEATATALLGDWVVILWAHGCAPTNYNEISFSQLRLAVKTRKVKVRLYRDRPLFGKYIYAHTDAGTSRDNTLECPDIDWVSDIIEVEVPE